MSGETKEEADPELIAQTLMVLTVNISLLQETAEQIRVQVDSLSRRQAQKDAP